MYISKFQSLMQLYLCSVEDVFYRYVNIPDHDRGWYVFSNFFFKSDAIFEFF